ncbi:MAG: hypothetical protein LBV44_07875 [Methylobacillus sp.]|jgi:hypothetical protein|nr:hypothetical protein [Methylobacillus sp.]
MRRLIRKAVFSAVLLALCVALMGFGTARENATGADWVSNAMGGGGFLVAFFAVIHLVMTLHALRGMARLLGGHGKIAQWHVSATEWEKFRMADPTRTKTNPTFLRNILQLSPRTPREGVEIVIGEKGVLVGGDYHGLGGLKNLGWLNNANQPGRPPDCLEFLFATTRGKSGVVAHSTLRVPVPETAFAQAALVQRHFAPNAK